MLGINRRDALLVAGGAAFALKFPSPAFANLTHDWAEIAAKHLAARGVLPVLNEHDDLWKPGARLGVTTMPGHKLIQRHVDWFTPKGEREGDPTPGIHALIGNIADEIAPLTELKTFTLLIPKRGDKMLDAANLSYGYLKLRVLRDNYVYWDENDMPFEGYVTRVDILFPKALQACGEAVAAN